MCTGGHGRDRQRRRSRYASKYSTSPYTTLAAVPNTITGPATVNILTAVPVTMPSARKSMAGEATALAKPVMGTGVPRQPVVQPQRRQQHRQEHQRYRGGGGRLLLRQPQRLPAVGDQLSHGADPAADDKGQRRVLADG